MSKTTKEATTIVDYQARAKEFSVGDHVFRFLKGDPWKSGTVLAVYPAIGFVDVAWPWGTERVSVDELQIKQKGGLNVKPPEPDNAIVPGGTGTAAPVSSGPDKKAAMLARIAKAYHAVRVAWLMDDMKALSEMGVIPPSVAKVATSWKARTARHITKDTQGLEAIAGAVRSTLNNLATDYQRISSK